jgi:hypothetical protein
MSKFKRHNNILLVLLGVLFSAVVSSLIYTQPYSGDLTRLGAYLENSFGANLPQEKFKTPLFRRAASLQEYDQYFDVVVVGDSFSGNVERGWQNYLVADTGWSVISFHMDRIDLAELFETRVYRESPPKVFIYQSIERNMIYQHPYCDLNSSNLKSTVDLKIAMRPTQPQIDLEFRKKWRAFSQYFDASPVFNYVRKSVVRSVFEDDSTPVYRFNLKEDARGLFSNSENDQILIYKKTLKKIHFDRHYEKRLWGAGCGLLTLQNWVQKTNETAFLALIFPNKISVYSDYIDDESYQIVSIASRFEAMVDLNIVQLKSKLDSAVNDGTVDLYLPNDTHCGHACFRLAADSILEIMLRKGWIETS